MNNTYKPVILCGGKATRLPHKLMLCDRNGQWIVERLFKQIRTEYWSAPVMLCDTAANPVITAASSSEEIFGYQVLEDGGEGIPRTLVNAATSFANFSHLSVFCADNVYSLEHMNPFIGLTIGKEDSVAAVNMIVEVTQLDFWKEGKWWDREENDTKVQHLMTPWLLSTKSLSSVSKTITKSTSVPDLLNMLRCTPRVVSTCGWADLGTPESVERYYQL